MDKLNKIKKFIEKHNSLFSLPFYVALIFLVLEIYKKTTSWMENPDLQAILVFITLFICLTIIFAWTLFDYLDRQIKLLEKLEGKK